MMSGCRARSCNNAISRIRARCDPGRLDRYRSRGFAAKSAKSAKSNGPVVERGAFHRRGGPQNRGPCERRDAIPASDAPGAAEGRSAQVEAGRHAPCVRDRQARQPDVRGRGRFIRAQSEETRLNSSHSSISYAVFCLKKKKTYKNLFLIIKKKTKKNKTKTTYKYI